MTLEATDIERRLRANRDALILKEHVPGKSEAWKHLVSRVLLVTWVQSSDSVHRAIIKPFLPIMDSHRVGSGRVTIFVGRVGSDLEIWTRVQPCVNSFRRSED